MKRDLVALLLLSFRCLVKCFVALPHGVVGWSAVCDFVTILTYFLLILCLSYLPKCYGIPCLVLILRLFTLFPFLYETNILPSYFVSTFMQAA